MLKPRIFFFAAVSLTAALTLSSCAGAGPTAESSNSAETTVPAAFNDADVLFAQMMLPHHEQAVKMSDDLLTKDGIDQGVLDLAGEIKATQTPEIAQLKGWLTEWNADDNSMSGMGGMGDGSNGMMSDEDMMALQDASGTDASGLFLTQMTAHHQGAVAMAQLEVDNGENSDAQAMAANIVKTQTAEIAVMAKLLATL